MSDEVVTTCADAGFYRGLRLLHASLGGAYPLWCADLGLGPPQADWCRAAGVRLLAGPDLPLPAVPAGMGDRERRLWAKPFLVEAAVAAGARRVLWVDSMWCPDRPFRPGAAATHPHKLP